MQNLGLRAPLNENKMQSKARYARGACFHCVLNALKCVCSAGASAFT